MKLKYITERYFKSCNWCLSSFNPNTPYTMNKVMFLNSTPDSSWKANDLACC